MAHTPGPWSQIDDLNVFCAEHLICECHVPLVNDPEGDEWYLPEVKAAVAEAGANARLVAAAPDLLFAAREALNGLGEMLWDNPGEPEYIALLRAAITKAEEGAA